MKRRNVVGVVAGAVALAGAAMAPGAQATGTGAQQATAACSVWAGSVTAAGAETVSIVTAGTPPTRSEPDVTTDVFAPGKVRLASSFVLEPNVAGEDMSGYVVEGDTLYYSFVNRNTNPDALTRVGGGWSNFTALEDSEYYHGNAYHKFAYGLRSDGTLFRWNLGGSGWKAAGSAPGFASVKSMALISKTATYDTFLANTRGGALYTIRIPITTAMKPIVKQVRAKTWQGFETLIASQCGQFGTMLIGIDKDTKTGYAYAVGHANGTATVINGLGKVNATFPDPVNFRWGVVADLDPLDGE